MASDFQLRQAASLLCSGEIIAYQTDTLYGLSCDPYNQAATIRLNTLKQRPPHKTFILLAADFSQLSPLLPADVIRQQANITASGCSWVVEAAAHTPHWLKASDGSIAIRISKDPLTKHLCGILKQPVISTSANISGQRVMSNALQCRKLFGSNIAIHLRSAHPFSGKPSKLRKLCDNSLIRG